MYNLPTYKTPPNRWYVRESRPYDFLYDSTYTVPSRADFLSSLRYGVRSGARAKIKPVHDTMFSAIKTQPRNIVCLNQLKPGVVENFMPEYDVNGMPIIPADTGPLAYPRLVDEVTGANRAKYAIRYGPPTYKLGIRDYDFQAEDQQNQNLYDKSKRTVNRSMQTDYRESECQTDPYSPPYVLPYPGAYPQLLALVKLTWEKGLPFSLDDIVIIDRALSKRILEYVEREVENEKDFEKRIKLMEELEAQQWADREKELDKLTQRKIELTTRLLQEYSTRVANEHTLRLERLHAQLKQKTQENFQQIKHQYFRDLRKLEKKYLHKREPIKRDIIKDYTEFDSRVYAPLTRNGAGIDMLGEEPTEFNWNMHDFECLDKITNDPKFIKSELTFDVDRFKDRLERCRPTGTLKRLEKKLEDIYLSFKGHGMKGKEQMNYLGRFGARGDVDARPDTPEIAIEENREEELRKPHVVLLQKIARGRTIQKLIRNEIDRNMNEILGLKLMFDMDPNCQRLEESQLQKLMAMKKNADTEESRDTPVEEVVGHLEGETLAKMIDFLDKEMVRLLDERKIHALILLAERERKMKEAAEGGRRFKEEEIRRANDEIFKQITGIHQATVDMYLEEVFLESCDRTADDQSRLYVQKLATTLNDALYSAKHSITDFEQEELAADLVSSFMIPELHRLYHRSRVDTAGARFTKASVQVVDAVCAAHPVTKRVMDDMEPLVDDHLIRSQAALDGGVEFVNEVIQRAVQRAMRFANKSFDSGTGTTFSGTTDSSSSKTTSTPSSENKTDSSTTDQPKSTEATVTFSEDKDKVKTSSDDSSGSVVRKEPALSFARPTIMGFGLDDKKDSMDSGEIQLKGEDEEEETVAEMEESQMTAAEADSKALDDAEDEGGEDDEGDEDDEEELERKRSYTICVDDDVVRRLAAKSVQIEYGTEPGQFVEAAFLGASTTMEEVFDEVKKRVLPPKMDDSASDATLSDDTDD